MPRLNLHAHTTYSDGANSLRDMAVLAKGSDFVAFISSDHDYLMDAEKYERQLAEARWVSWEVGFPVICGLELSLWHEEAVLIGEEACKAWLAFRDSFTYSVLPNKIKNITREEILAIIGAFEYGLCLVHPARRGPKELYSIFHCYEIMNSGRVWPPHAITELENLLPEARQVKGIDAHCKDDLVDEYYKCDEVIVGVWDETSIIQWMKGLL